MANLDLNEVKKSLNDNEQLMNFYYNMIQNSDDIEKNKYEIEIEKLEKANEDVKKQFQEACNEEIENKNNEISEICDKMQFAKDDKEKEDYKKQLETLNDSIENIQKDLKELGILTENHKEVEEESKTEKNEKKAEEKQENKKESEEQEQETSEKSEDESVKDSQDNEKDDKKSRFKIIQLFKNMMAKLKRVLGIKSKIVSEIEKRPELDINKINEDEIKKENEEIEEIEPNNEIEQDNGEIEQQNDEKAELENKQSKKDTIIRRFGRLVAQNAKAEMLNAKLSYQLKKRGLEVFIDDSKNKATESFGKAKDSVANSKVGKAIKETKDTIVLGADVVIGNAIYAKDATKEGIKNAGKKAIYGFKTAGKITIGTGALAVEAVGKAKETVIDAGKSTIQGVVNGSKDIANSLLDKLEDRAHRKEAMAFEKQMDLKKGNETKEEKAGPELA